MKVWPYIHLPTDKTLLIVEAETITEADEVFNTTFEVVIKKCDIEKLPHVVVRIKGKYGPAIELEEAKKLVVQKQKTKQGL